MILAVDGVHLTSASIDNAWCRHAVARRDRFGPNGRETAPATSVSSRVPRRFPDRLVVLLRPDDKRLWPCRSLASRMDPERYEKESGS